MKPSLMYLLGMFGGGARQTLAGYLLELGALLIYDGTLTDDSSKLRNKGSLGSAADGTPSNLTINENGMVFNGTNSQIDVPDVAGLQGLTSREIVVVGRMLGAGQFSAGTFFRWGTTTTRAALVASGTILAFVVDYDGASDAITLTATPDDERRTYFFTHNHSTRTPQIIYGEGGTLVTPTQSPTAGVGNLTAVSTLRIGNNQSLSGAWDGTQEIIAWFDRQLTTQERQNIAFLAQ